MSIIDKIEEAYEHEEWAQRFNISVASTQDSIDNQEGIANNIQNYINQIEKQIEDAAKLKNLLENNFGDNFQIGVQALGKAIVGLKDIQKAYNTIRTAHQITFRDAISDQEHAVLGQYDEDRRDAPSDGSSEAEKDLFALLKTANYPPHKESFQTRLQQSVTGVQLDLPSSPKALNLITTDRSSPVSSDSANDTKPTTDIVDALTKDSSSGASSPSSSSSGFVPISSSGSYGGSGSSSNLGASDASYSHHHHKINDDSDRDDKDKGGTHTSSSSGVGTGIRSLDPSHVAATSAQAASLGTSTLNGGNHTPAVGMMGAGMGGFARGAGQNDKNKNHSLQFIDSSLLDFFDDEEDAGSNSLIHTDQIAPTPARSTQQR